VGFAVLNASISSRVVRPTETLRFFIFLGFFAHFLRTGMTYLHDDGFPSSSQVDFALSSEDHELRQTFVRQPLISYLKQLRQALIRHSFFPEGPKTPGRG
jgi:hypothetical protein